MSRSGVLTQVDTLLGSVSGMTPSFVAVSRGEPLSIPALPWCAFWVSGLNVIADMDTFTDESTITDITIRSFHPAALDPATNEKVVEEVWNAIAGIRSSLLGDSDLGGNASQINLNSATVENMEINGNWFTTTTQILEVWILSDTTVAP